MDVWIALFNAETINEDIIGVYTSEESALKAAELISPGETRAEQFVLDEIPDWAHDFAAEEAANNELT
jgi:hypothetical protein